MTPRLQVRRSKYRGVDGWLICGGARDIYATRIFSRSEAEARRIAADLRVGLPCRFDTQPDPEQERADALDRIRRNRHLWQNTEQRSDTQQNTKG